MKNINEETKFNGELCVLRFTMSMEYSLHYKKNLLTTTITYLHHITEDFFAK